jgi:uncharacterized membrane protein YkoI
MNRFTFSVIAVLAVGAVACSTTGFSAFDDSADAKRKAKADRIAAFQKALSSSKTTLAKAIEAAEKHTGGTAFACEYELEQDGKLELEVELLKDGQILEAEIDVATGAVIEVESDDDADDADDDDDEGDDDDDKKDGSR